MNRETIKKANELCCKIHELKKEIETLESFGMDGGFLFSIKIEKLDNRYNGIRLLANEFQHLIENRKLRLEELEKELEAL